jgi:adenylylsulfate kinase/chloramphenicol 3-O phosphotransferase
MYHTAKLFSDMGHDVLIDGILVERPEIAPHYQQMMNILADNPLSIVEVACSLEICRERNIARGDRHESQSQEQAEIMARDIRYAMTVHTDQNTPEECAEAIVRQLMK